MKKRILALLLAFGCLAGCSQNKPPEVTPPATVPAEEQIDYDWMAGDSPVPNRRVGLNRGWSMNTTVQTVSQSGTYFIYHPGWVLDVTPPSPWILYMDHGSDTVIKLCGRPDCGHDTTDCNAFVDSAQSVHFYNGYLYVISSGPIMTEDNQGKADIYYVTKLLRMDPDGTNRVELFNFTDYVRQNGGDFAQCYFLDGYCQMEALVYETDPDAPVTTDSTGTYLYKLDGSMKEPEPVTFEVGPLYNCGDRLLAISDDQQSYWDLDTDTMEKTYLMDFPGAPAFCYEEQAIYFKDGELHRVTYATGEDEVVLKTELTGNYLPYCFPDCIVLADNDYSRLTPDRNLYIYNWAFEPVDTVTLNFPTEKLASQLIISENPRQIILSDGGSAALPSYCIDKTELGTGNVQLHRLKAPDIATQQQQMEEQEDRQWFENN